MNYYPQANQLFDKKFLYRCLFTLAAMCVAMKLSGGALFALFIPAILSAMFQGKTEKLLFWLLAAITAIIANYNFAPKNWLFMLAQRAIMVTVGVCMSVQIFGHKTDRVVSPFMGMVLYVLYMIVPSCIGWSLIVSCLKLFLFMVTYFSFLGAVNQLGYDNRVSSAKVRSIMLAFAIFFLLGSMALLPFPGLAQMSGAAYEEAMKNGVTLQSLYCGMTNHSQCLGPVVATLGVVVLGDFLFSVRRTHRLYLALLLSCPFLIYKTSSRTGMASFMLGVLYLTYLFAQSRGVSSRWKSKVMSMVMTLVVIGSVVVMASPRFSEGIQKFALKSGGAGEAVTVEKVTFSRMGLVDKALYNFKQSPLFGNGFQVSPEMADIDVSDIRRLLSAPIEKGVWIFAVLEEGGALGWLLLVGIFAVCIFSSVRNHAYIGAATLFTLLMTNMGEFSMFSMSYSGGFCWAMVFMGLALDAQRNKEARMAFRRQPQW